MLPFAYLKSIFHQLLACCRQYSSQRLLRLVFFLFLGPLILLVSIFTDAYWFIVRTCDMSESKKTTKPFVVRLAAFNKLIEIVNKV